MPTSNDTLVRSVAPALGQYRQDAVEATLWARPQLSRRDRSLVTIAALIARDHTAEQERYVELFRDLWLRPGLAPRDRSVVTVTALIANGHVAQVPFHLNRAMDHGLTREEAGEAIAHIAFYAGWPTAFSAVAVAKDVFEKRGK